MSVCVVGVRQKTVRQQSTMDNAGTLPIYTYDNVGEVSYERFSPAVQVSPIVALDEHRDDIAIVQEESSASTRSGRTSKRRKHNDFIHY